MSDEHLRKVPEILRECAPGVITLVMSADDYFDVLRGAVRYGDGSRTLLICSSLPASLLFSTLDGLGEQTAEIKAVDCISETLMHPKEASVCYVESPRFLEILLLETRRALLVEERGTTVLLDSVNALTLHNSRERTVAFLEALSNRLRREGHLLVLFYINNTVGKQESIMHDLEILSDRIIVLGDSESNPF